MRAHIRWGSESGWLLGVIEGRGIKTGEVGMMGSGVGVGDGGGHFHSWWIGGEVQTVKLSRLEMRERKVAD